MQTFQNVGDSDAATAMMVDEESVYMEPSPREDQTYDAEMSNLQQQNQAAAT